MPDVIEPNKQNTQLTPNDSNANQLEDEKISAQLSAARKYAEEQAQIRQDKYAAEDQAAEEELLTLQLNSNVNLTASLLSTFEYFETRGRNSGWLSNTTSDYFKRVEDFQTLLTCFTLNYPVNTRGFDKEVTDMLQRYVQQHVINAAKKISSGQYRINLTALTSTLEHATCFDIKLIEKLQNYFTELLHTIELYASLKLTSSASIAEFSAALHRLQAAKVAINLHHYERETIKFDQLIDDMDKQIAQLNADNSDASSASKMVLQLERQVLIEQRERNQQKFIKFQNEQLNVNPLTDTLDLIQMNSKRSMTMSETTYLKQRIHILRHLDKQRAKDKVRLIEKKCKDFDLAPWIVLELHRVTSMAMMEKLLSHIPCEDKVKANLLRSLEYVFLPDQVIIEQNNMKLAVIDMISEYIAAKKYDLSCAGVKRAYELSHEIIDTKTEKVAEVIHEFLAHGQTQIEKSVVTGSGFFKSHSNADQHSLRGVLLKNLGQSKYISSGRQLKDIPSLLSIMQKLDSYKPISPSTKNQPAMLQLVNPL